MLLGEKETMATFAEYAKSTRVEMRKRCIGGFTHIVANSAKKNANTVARMLSALANPDILLNTQDFASELD